MKLAYSSNAYTRATLLDAIDSIGRLGYDGIEILCDHPHWFPGHVDQRELEAVRDRIAEYGLSVSNLNANTANVYFDPLPPENVFEPSLSSADEGSAAGASNTRRMPSSWPGPSVRPASASPRVTWVRADCRHAASS